jgi:NAD(P)H-hydrate epimerase
MTDDELAALLPPILRDAHKYTRGSLLVLAGSLRFSGAAVLAAQAAARAGAGYVTLAVPEPVAAIARAHLLSIPVIAAYTDASKTVFAPDAWAGVRDQLSHLDAIVFGPGITLTPETSALFCEVVRDAPCPLLLDADALNILSVLVREGFVFEPPSRPLVLTPHPGELKRLLEATKDTDVLQLARTLGAVVVAKGAETRIVSSTQSHLFTAGTPALAKAGTGDVLAGIIGSFMAQGATPFEAAVLGVELHGRAGCLAEQQLGRRSVCAEDLIDTLPVVLKTLKILS